MVRVEPVMQPTLLLKKLKQKVERLLQMAQVFPIDLGLPKWLLILWKNGVASIFL